MRERALQAVLLVLGLFYCFWGYLLYESLSGARWMSQHSDVMPMFLSLNTALGPCLLLAVRNPGDHRLIIFYGALSSLTHASAMTIQSMQAAARGMHRHDSPQDIVMFVLIGLVLLILFPQRRRDPAVATAAWIHRRRPTP